MQIFLGDEITIIKDGRDNTTIVTGQVAGIVLDDDKEVQSVYIHNLQLPFYMADGWKFVDNDEYEEEEDDEI